MKKVFLILALCLFTMGVSAQSKTYKIDGIPFEYENPTIDNIDEWAETYEDEMLEQMMMLVRDNQELKKMVMETVDEDPHLAYVIIMSDHSDSKKLKWFQQYMEYQQDKRPYSEMQELTIKLYKEIYNDLKKKNK